MQGILEQGNALETEPTLDDASDYRFEKLYRKNSIEKRPDYQYQYLNLPFFRICDTFGIKSNLVDFTNQFVTRIRHRLKENPIIAKQTDNGKIKVVRYKSENLIKPLVKDILSTGLRGSVCVLTYTNDEALQVSEFQFVL